MSLVLLVDGYNVVAPVAAPKGDPDRWLQAERNRLIRRLIDHLPKTVCSRTCVVFDAKNPPPDRPSEFEVGGVQVRFAVGYPQADDLIEEMIAAHTSPKRLAVVSSDLRVQAAATRRGAVAFQSQSWLDDLLDGNARLATGVVRAGQGSADREEEPSKPQVDENDVDQWMSDFGFS